MDDMWSTQVLNDVNWIFPNDHNGSRILLTTRLSDVAVYAHTSGSIHQMPFLNEEQSWKLLQEKVFLKEPYPSELEEPGKLIANSCRGLPLAIVVVAGILSKINRTRYAWAKIAKNVSSVVMSSNDEHFAKILYLSYNHLPHHLKPCFLYFGAFPEDYEISVSRLIKLWIAEGFLRPIEFKSLEEVGEEYLEDLVKRNLVLITKRRSNGKLKSCSIHDLLRDLCTQKVRSENFFHVMDENLYFRAKGTRNIRIEKDREYIRRVCIHPSYFSSIGAEDIGSHVHSILCFSDSYIVCKNLFSSALGFKLLRILDAIQILFTSFPGEIVKLFHLRFFACKIYINRNLSFPPTISRLQNLQTLIVTADMMSPNAGYISLPSEIWKMPKLRHLMIKSFLPILHSANMVGEVHVLENLQILDRVENFVFTEEALEMFPNLKKLKVTYRKYKSYGKWQQYCLNNLVRLCQLETLNVFFYMLAPLWDVDPFPENFCFPQNLKKLSLRGCKLPWEDLTVVGSLPNLEVLKLRDEATVGTKWEPIEGEFLRLKFLLMRNLDLKYWQAQHTHFSTLEHLVIRCCTKLEEIPPQIGEIPILELIEVRGCKLAAESAIRIQEEQRDMGNDAFRVRVYHN